MYVEQWISFVMHIRLFLRSLLHVCHVLQISRTTVTKILHKRVTLIAYKIQIVQALQPSDCYKRAEFAFTIFGSTSIRDFVIYNIYKQ